MSNESHEKADVAPSPQPAPGVAAWSDREIVECFRAQGRGGPWKRLWALAVGLRRPGLLPAAELAALLEVRDPIQLALAAQFTADAIPWGLPPEILEAATDLACRTPRGTPSALARRFALEILAESGQGRNLKPFARALRDGERADQIIALEGIARSNRTEGVNVIRRAIGGSAMETPVLLNAIGALLSLEAPEALDEILPIVHRRLVEEKEFHWLDLLPSLRWIGIHFEAVESLIDYFARNDLRQDPWREMMPREDEPAAARALELLTPPVRKTLHHHAARRHPRLMVVALADLLRDALDAAAAQNPGFAGLARSMRVFTDAVADRERLDELHGDGYRSLAAVLAAFVAKAIRGRRVDREREAVLRDPPPEAGRIESLFKVNEPWIPASMLGTLARAMPPARFERFASSEDLFVAQNARSVLATLEPERWLGPALDGDEELDYAYQPLLQEAFRIAGESALEVVTERLPSATDAIRAAGDLAIAVAWTGTARARAALLATIDPLLESDAPHFWIFDALLHAGTKDLAQRFLQAVRDGTVGLLGTDASASGRFTLLAHVRLLHGRFDLEGRPRDIVIAGIRHGRAQANLLEREEALHDGEAYGSDAEDEPVETIRRDAPKVGRNDPCPCGSDKKYKRCCGR